MLDRLRNCRGRDAQPLRRRGNADDRLLLKQLVNPEGGCGRASEILDPVPIGFEQSEDLARRLGRLQRCLGDAVEEELQPCLPVAILADLLQQVVILAAMCLEVEAEIEDRLLQGKRFLDDTFPAFA